MMYREIIIVCSEIHTKHISTLCGQNVEFVSVEPGGAWTGHWSLKGYNSYRAVNTPHLHYTDRPVNAAYRNNRWLWKLYEMHEHV
jgi:hypothetical protein